MKNDNLDLSVCFLKQVLDGVPYAEIGRANDLHRSAVEQRVKRVARDLQRVVGVEDVDDDALINTELLHAKKAQFLEALEHYRPDLARRDGAARAVIDDAEIDFIAARIEASSACVERDKALLLLLFGTGLKAVEVGGLLVCDYLLPDGAVRVESELRAGAAFNGTARKLYFASAKLRAAIDDYLAERIARRQGLGPDRRYRGLDPDSPLFLTRAGTAADDAAHRRSIALVYRRLFQLARVAGLTATAGRRTAVARLAAQGVGRKHIGSLLGVGQSAVGKLAPDAVPLTRAMRDLLQ